MVLFNKYIKMNQKLEFIKIIEFVKISVHYTKSKGVRVDPGPALARPDWPGVKMTRGQGQGPAKMGWPWPGPALGQCRSTRAMRGHALHSQSFKCVKCKYIGSVRCKLPIRVLYITVMYPMQIRTQPRSQFNVHSK